MSENDSSRTGILELLEMMEMSIWTWMLLVFLLYKLLDRLVRIPLLGGCSERYVVVTGASRGLGFETVRRLDALGCHVFAGIRTTEAAEKLRSVCSTRVDPVVIDLNRSETMQEALRYITSKLPTGRGLWGLINNAGCGVQSGMEWLQMIDYQEHIDVNILGTVSVTMAFLPLIKRERGRVINMTSILGILTVPNALPYCMTKYAIESYSDSLRRVMKSYGVKVAIVEAGGFQTDILMDAESGIMKTWERMPQELRDELGQQSLENVLNGQKLMKATASGRIGDVVDVYVHALLGRYPRARYVVGIDAKYVYLPLTVLPEWLSDYLLQKIGEIKVD